MMADYRDELIEMQRKIIESQTGALAVMRAALAASQQKVKEQALQLEVARSSNGTRKDVQA